jgi:hypothetical protein
METKQKNRARCIFEKDSWYVASGGHATQDPQEAEVFFADLKRTKERFTRYGYNFIPVTLVVLS